MSRQCNVILLGVATAFPSGGRPGDILVGEAGAINGAVAIVAGDGSPVAIEATPYVPTDDNLTDLGTTGARFRTLYLGTSIVNTASLTIDLRNSVDTTLTLSNSLAGVANLAIDGGLTVAGALSFFGTTARTQLAAIADPTGGGTVDTQARTAIVDILTRMRAAAGYGLIAT